MGAILMGSEEFAIALEGAIGEHHTMCVVITLKGNIKGAEMEAFPLLRVSFGFLDLADQARLTTRAFVYVSKMLAANTRIGNDPVKSI
jgi:hypothetical protein